MSRKPTKKKKNPGTNGLKEVIFIVTNRTPFDNDQEKTESDI